MGKIINIDEINRAAMEGREDVLVDLCRVFDHESYFDPIFDPPESFLQVETVCDGTEPLTAKVKRLIFSDREVAC